MISSWVFWESWEWASVGGHVTHPPPPNMRKTKGSSWLWQVGSLGPWVPQPRPPLDLWIPRISLTDTSLPLCTLLFSSAHLPRTKHTCSCRARRALSPRTARTSSESCSSFFNSSLIWTQKETESMWPWSFPTPGPLKVKVSCHLLGI